MRSFEKNLLVNILKNHFPAHSKILDVGCGIGQNLELLARNGYVDVVGTDISNDMLQASRDKGFRCYPLEDLGGFQSHFDLIIFSHVLEHIEYSQLQQTLETYFSLLTPQGRVVILCPTLYDGFFADVDHIKPYYPDGISNLFSNRNISRQYCSSYKLTLIDLRFRRESLLPYNMRCRFFNDFASVMLFKSLYYFFKFLKICSFDVCSKTTGYIALYAVDKGKSK